MVAHRRRGFEQLLDRLGLALERPLFAIAAHLDFAAALTEEKVEGVAEPRERGIRFGA